MNKQKIYNRIVQLKLTRIALVCIAILLIGCSKDNNANKFYLANATYDFGNTSGNQILKTTFIIDNLFDVPTEIVAVNSSCKCVKTTYAKKLLQPNESMEIAVEFDTKGFRGMQKKSITIETNHKNNKYIRFSVQTHIEGFKD
ncbi:DUF1573 domain-containing protein [uncultured Kordia sp.]|uniref:DUF1573 domain-containing protein n=1 Tax=uncultured Kordia sp. TaxID=507699 RepID=UPI002623D3C1|nr:DUF1573 domain-containing protein [uncultured Kordia sp.]